RSALVLDFLLAEREFPVNHAPTAIGSLAQQRIAHDVEIGVARQAETGGESGASRLFDVDEQFGGVAEAHSGVQSHQARGGFFIARAETMRAAVESAEIGVGLKDEIGLT